MCVVFHPPIDVLHLCVMSGGNRKREGRGSKAKKKVASESKGTPRSSQAKVDRRARRSSRSGTRSSDRGRESRPTTTQGLQGEEEDVMTTTNNSDDDDDEGNDRFTAGHTEVGPQMNDAGAGVGMVASARVSHRRRGSIDATINKSSLLLIFKEERRREAEEKLRQREREMWESERRKRRTEKQQSVALRRESFRMKDDVGHSRTHSRIDGSDSDSDSVGGGDSDSNSIARGYDPPGAGGAQSRSRRNSSAFSSLCPSPRPRKSRPKMEKLLIDQRFSRQVGVQSRE